MKDIIDYKGDTIELKGYLNSFPNKISDFKLINFKREPGKYKRIHITSMSFNNSEFKDVDFIGGVPIDGSSFKNCTFENCMLTDHIRYSTFDNCSFKNCIFAGYFHGTTLKKNCTFDTVSLDFYGDDSYFLGKRTSTGYSYIIKKLDSVEKDKKKLYKYFYPIEYAEYEQFEVGHKYYIDVEAMSTFFERNKEAQKRIITIDSREYHEDIINEIRFNLRHNNIEIEIIGRYLFDMKYCISENEITAINREKQISKIL